MSADERPAPPRPHLPPLLLAGLALWAATALIWPATAAVSRAALIGGGAVAAASALGLAVGCLHGRRMPLGAVVLLGLAAAGAVCPISAAALEEAGEAARSAAGAVWQCTLTTDAKPSEFGYRAEARARDGNGCEVEVRLNLPEEAAGLLQGETVVARGAVRASSPASAERDWNAGLSGSLIVDAADVATATAPPLVEMRRRAIEQVATYGGGEAPLIQALVCGWRSAMESSGAYGQFKTVGLAHLVAVSGAHLSIVTLFVAAALRALRLGRRATAAATGLFLLGYVGFTGMPVSALRAALMAATGLLSLLTDRRSSALSALGLCLVLFIGLDPPCALSASFVLSAGSTLGIVLFAPLLSAPFAGLPRPVRSLLVDPLALTGSSALVTQPYAAALFAQVPLLSPVANLLAATLFTLGCVVGFLAVLGALLVPGTAPVLIAAAAAAVAPLSGLVAALADVPRSCLPVDADPAAMAALSAALAAGLWAWWPAVRPRALAGVATAVLLVGALVAGWPRAAADEIVMLDVGQGDAFLVRSQGAALLIDTGNQDAMLKEACARQGIAALDRVAISHGDDDHCGSLEALGDVAEVGGLLVADDLLRCPCSSCADLLAVAARERYAQGVAGLSVGDRIACGRFTLEVVWPDGFTEEGGNGDSLSFLCLYDGDGDGTAEWSALFCGDAEAEELAAMADRLPAGGVDVLKVGHHGSKKSLDDELARRLAPSIALIGVGEHNRYGHPAPAVLAALEEAGAEVLCSDEAGDVAVAFSMEKLAVTAERGEAVAQSGTIGP